MHFLLQVDLKTVWASHSILRDKKIKYFEALDVRVPGAGPETPEEVPEEPETEPLLGTDIEI